MKTMASWRVTEEDLRRPLRDTGMGVLYAAFQSHALTQERV